MYELDHRAVRYILMPDRNNLNTCYSVACILRAHKGFSLEVLKTAMGGGGGEHQRSLIILAEEHYPFKKNSAFIFA